MNRSRDFQELRHAVRALCAGLSEIYHCKVDEQRVYPDSFVDALTKDEWMAALIPQEYGSSGLESLSDTPVMRQLLEAGR